MALALVVVLAAAMVWYGLMVFLLAVKVAPGMVDTISGYRTVFDALRSIGPGDLDAEVRLITAASGMVAFVVFGALFVLALPRPHRTRRAQELPLPGEQSSAGRTTVAPRAYERIAEAAAARAPAIEQAAGRLDGAELAVSITMRTSEQPLEVLRSAQDRVRAALERHGLAVVPVNVTLASHEGAGTRRVL
ncbi:MAG: hypothetical protein ACR2NA_05490 [Solirubrobacterales bacterium]